MPYRNPDDDSWLGALDRWLTTDTDREGAYETPHRCDPCAKGRHAQCPQLVGPVCCDGYSMEGK